MSLARAASTGRGRFERRGACANAGRSEQGSHTRGAPTRRPCTRGSRSATTRYPLTPNDLINAGPGGRHEFPTWTAKAHGTYEMPWDVRVTPVIRHQSGQSFGRTFTASLQYGTVAVLANRGDDLRPSPLMTYNRVFRGTPDLKVGPTGVAVVFRATSDDPRTTARSSYSISTSLVNASSGSTKYSISRSSSSSSGVGGGGGGGSSAGILTWR